MRLSILIMAAAALIGCSESKPPSPLKAGDIRTEAELPSTESRDELQERCEPLMVDPASDRDLTADQLSAKTRAYAQCLGIPVIDWCDLPAADRAMLEKNDMHPHRQCP